MNRLLTLAVLTSPLVSCAEGGDDHLVLLQQHASTHAHEQTILRKQEVASAGYGDAVALSEKGYQTVVALKSDAEMKSFIRRIAEKEARRITDEAALSGLAPYYSGTTQTQSLASLKQELRSAPWVADGEGRTAPLTEAGYQQVAHLKSKPHMLAYARRILDFSGKKCTDEGALNGIVPYFSGEVSTQSFEQLKQELLSAVWAVSRAELEGAQHPVSLSETGTDRAIASKCEDWCGKDCEDGCSGGTVSGKDFDKQMHVMFDGFDLDNNGFIDRAELKKGMGRFDREFTDHDIDEMIVEADADGDGLIGIEEFQSILRK